MGPEGTLVALRFARGCRCFAVSIDGSVAGYGWLSTGREWIGEIQLEIAPGPGEGYVWNCVTLAAHRRKGIFRSLLLGISGAVQGEGLRRLWIGSVAIPAERAVGPSGFRPALRFDSTTLGGLLFLRVSPAGDPALAEAALAILGSGGKPARLGASLRRSRPRSH